MTPTRTAAAMRAAEKIQHAICSTTPDNDELARLIDAEFAEVVEAASTACVAVEIAIVGGDKAWKPVLDNLKSAISRLGVRGE